MESISGPEYDLEFLCDRYRSTPCTLDGTVEMDIGHTTRPGSFGDTTEDSSSWYVDVFAWTYQDMPGLDRSVAELRVDPYARMYSQREE